VLTLRKELIMWDKEPDIFEALEEHDFECESTYDFFDFEFDSETVVEGVEEDAFDEDNVQVEYEN